MAFSGWGGLGSILDEAKRRQEQEEEEKRKAEEAARKAALALALQRAGERDPWSPPVLPKAPVQGPTQRLPLPTLAPKQPQQPTRSLLSSPQLDTSTPDFTAPQQQSPTRTSRVQTPIAPVEPQSPVIAPRPMLSSLSDRLRDPYSQPDRPMVPTAPRYAGAQPEPNPIVDRWKPPAGWNQPMGRPAQQDSTGFVQPQQQFTLSPQEQQRRDAMYQPNQNNVFNQAGDYFRERGQELGQAIGEARDWWQSTPESQYLQQSSQQRRENEVPSVAEAAIQGIGMGGGLSNLPGAIAGAGIGAGIGALNKTGWGREAILRGQDALQGINEFGMAIANQPVPGAGYSASEFLTPTITGAGKALRNLDQFVDPTSLAQTNTNLLSWLATYTAQEMQKTQNLRKRAGAYVDQYNQPQANLALRNLVSGEQATQRTLDLLVGRDQRANSLEQQAIELRQSDPVRAGELFLEAKNLREMTNVDVVEQNMNPLAEFAYGMIFDPTNVVGPLVGLLGIAPEAQAARRAGRAVEVSTDAAIQRLQKAMAAGRDIGAAGDKAAKAYKSYTSSVPAAGAPGWIQPFDQAGRAITDALGLWQRTPASRAALDTEQLWKAVGAVLGISSKNPAAGITNKADVFHVLDTFATRADKMVKGLRLSAETMGKLAQPDGLVHWGNGLLGNNDTARRLPILSAAREQLGKMRSLSGDGPLVPTEFMAELHGVILDAAKTLNNVKPESALMELARLPATIQRYIMNDVWLGMRPANWAGNALGATTSLFANDSYTTMLRNADIDADLAAKGIWTNDQGRTIKDELGGSAIGAVANLVTGNKNNVVTRAMEELNNIPYGEMEIPLPGGGAIPLSEEAFRRRGFYVPFKRTFDAGIVENVNEKLVPDLQQIAHLAPDYVRSVTNFVIGTAKNGSKSDIATGIRKFVGKPEIRMALEELGVPPELISPQAARRIEQLIMDAGAHEFEPLMREISGILQGERNPAAQVLNLSPAQPGITDWTDVDMAQEAAWLADSIVDGARKAGGDIAQVTREATATAQRYVQEQADMFQRVNEEIAAAPNNPDTWSVVMDFWQDVLAAKTNARKIVDGLSQRATQMQTPEAWMQKWQGTKNIYDNLPDHLNRVGEEARVALQQVLNGNAYQSKHNWWDTIENYLGWDEEQFRMARTMELGSPDAADAELWQKVIGANREYIDNSVYELFGAFQRYPSLENFDIVRNGLQKVESMGAQIAATLEDLRGRLAAGEMSKAAYARARNLAWNNYFDAAVQHNEFLGKVIVRNGLVQDTASGLKWTEPDGATWQLDEPSTIPGKWWAHNLETNQRQEFTAGGKGEANPWTVPDEVVRDYNRLANNEQVIDSAADEVIEEIRRGRSSEYSNDFRIGRTQGPEEAPTPEVPTGPADDITEELPVPIQWREPEIEQGVRGYGGAAARRREPLPEEPIPAPHRDQLKAARDEAAAAYEAGPTPSQLTEAAEARYLSGEGYDAPNEWDAAMSRIAPEIQERFAVHGTRSDGLRKLLDEGVDTERGLASGPPTPGQYGVDTTRTDNPFLVIEQGPRVTNARNVVVNGYAAETIDQWRKAYPEVNFMTVDEAVDWMRRNPDVEFMPDVTTPTPNVTVPTNADIRKAASDTKDGRGSDRHLIASLNKRLGTSAKSLDDLTDAQRLAAIDVLAKRGAEQAAKPLAERLTKKQMLQQYGEQLKAQGLTDAQLSKMSKAEVAKRIEEWRAANEVRPLPDTPTVPGFILESPEPTVRQTRPTPERTAQPANMFAESGKSSPLISGAPVRGERFERMRIGRVPADRPRTTPEPSVWTVGDAAKLSGRELEETRAAMRAAWDKEVSAHLGLGKLDPYVMKYSKGGAVNMNLNRGEVKTFEDLYGRTVMGQPIENIDDVRAFLQRYVDLGEQIKQGKATIAKSKSFAKLSGAEIVNATQDELRAAGLSDSEIAELATQPRRTILDTIESIRGETPDEPGMVGYDYAVPDVAQLLGLESPEEVTFKTFRDWINRSRRTGNHMAPQVADVAQVQIKSINDLERTLRQRLPEMLRGQPNQLTGAQKLAVTDAVMKWLPEFDNVTAKAQRVGERMAGHVMLNYNDRRHFDTAMALLTPYHYFWSRMPSRVLMGALTKPSLVNFFYEANRSVDLENEQAGVPERLQGTLPIPGTNARINVKAPLRYAIPAMSYLQPNPFVQEDDSDNAAEKWINQYEKWGPGLNLYVQFMADLADGSIDKYYGDTLNSMIPIPLTGIPVSSAYQALTGKMPAQDGVMAKFGFGPDTADDGFGLDAYRARRAISYIGIEEKADQAIVAYAQQVILNQSNGDPIEKDIPPQFLNDAMALAERGVKRAAQDRIAGRTASYLTTMSVAPYPQAEVDAKALQAQRNAAGYNEQSNPYGSKELQGDILDATNPTLPNWWSKNSEAPGIDGQISDLYEQGTATGEWDTIYPQIEALKAQKAGITGEAVATEPSTKGMNPEEVAAAEQQKAAGEHWDAYFALPKEERAQYLRDNPDFVEIYDANEIKKGREVNHWWEDTSSGGGASDVAGTAHTAGAENITYADVQEDWDYYRDTFLLNRDSRDFDAELAWLKEHPESAEYEWRRYQGKNDKLPWWYDEIYGEEGAAQGAASLQPVTLPADKSHHLFLPQIEANSEQNGRKATGKGGGAADLGGGGGANWSTNWDEYRALGDNWDAKAEYMRKHPEFAEYYVGRYGEDAAWWLEGGGGSYSGGRDGFAKRSQRGDFNDNWSTNWDEYQGLGENWDAKKQYMLDNPAFAKYYKMRYGNAWWESDSNSSYGGRSYGGWGGYGGGYSGSYSDGGYDTPPQVYPTDMSYELQNWRGLERWYPVQQVQGTQDWQRAGDRVGPDPIRKWTPPRF